MSTMEVASRAGSSTLNPNAPLFIPASFQQVEDFSAEWWELVKTTSWFRDHWFHQHRGQETFDGDEEEEDIINLLPDTFDLGIDEEFLDFQEQQAFMEYAEIQNEFTSMSSAKKKYVNSGLESDAEALIRSLSLKSPNNGAVKPFADPSKYKGKPAKVISPKFSPHRIIQQPR